MQDCLIYNKKMKIAPAPTNAPTPTHALLSHPHTVPSQTLFNPQGRGWL